MAYRTITDESGDEFRFHYYVNEDGDDTVKVEYRKFGQIDFGLIFEGILKYIVPEQFE